MYIDATNIYGWAMSESLLYVEIEMWHGLPDLYMNKLEEILILQMIHFLVILSKLI